MSAIKDARSGTDNLNMQEIIDAAVSVKHAMQGGQQQYQTPEWLARACAKSTDAVFLKLAGPSLVQMYIGDGAKMIRDAFDLAKEKGKSRGGAIIFIDEIDAIGAKRQDGENGEREVQRTMLELLNQLDGFSSNDNVKVIAATNRPDILDPALLRSGRLDRKIELPLPDEKARVRILQIHCRKMNVDKAGAWRMRGAAMLARVATPDTARPPPTQR